MNTTTKGLTALSMAFLLSVAAAPVALAKGHNQGMDSSTSTTPGENVGSETVSNSVNEGADQRSGKAPEKGHREAPGKAGSAGRTSMQE